MRDIGNEKRKMKSEKKKLNKSGGSYISVCIIVIFGAMVVSLGIFFAGSISTAYSVRENVSLVMDGFIIENSIDIYQNIKKGEDYLEVLNKNLLEEKIVSSLCLASTGSEYEKKDTNENVIYKLSVNDIAFSQEHSLKIVSNITIKIPVEFNGNILFWLSIPMNIRSSFIMKI